MTVETNTHRRGRGRVLFWLVATMLIASVALKWAWNGAGVTLLSLPIATFSQIAAMLIALLAVLGLVRLVIGVSTRRHDH